MRLLKNVIGFTLGLLILFAIGCEKQLGDPFKDTSGPSLNILIKLMSMVSVVFAGLIAKYGGMLNSWLGM